MRAVNLSCKHFVSGVVKFLPIASTITKKQNNNGSEAAVDN